MSKLPFPFTPVNAEQKEPLTLTHTGVPIRVPVCVPVPVPMPADTFKQLWITDSPTEKPAPRPYVLPEEFEPIETPEVTTWEEIGDQAALKKLFADAGLLDGSATASVWSPDAAELVAQQEPQVVSKGAWDAYIEACRLRKQHINEVQLYVSAELLKANAVRDAALAECETRKAELKRMLNEAKSVPVPVAPGAKPAG